MGDSNGRLVHVPTFKGGQEVSASQFNDLSNAIRAMNTGSGLNQQTPFDAYTLDFPPALCKADVVLTDNTIATAAILGGGFITVDGLVTDATFKVLIAVEANGGAAGSDGLYKPDSGRWYKIVGMSPTKPGYSGYWPHNTPIFVGRGTSAPRMFVTGDTGVQTF